MSTYRFIKPRRSVSRVFIHCSASDNPDHDNVATIDLWHKKNGWSGTGYHIFIRKDGTVELGRSLELVPAAQAGHNTGTIAICLHGLDIDKFTNAQKQALVTLCHDINRAYDGKLTFHGHREVAAKACPVIDYKGLLSLTASGKLPWREFAESGELKGPNLTGMEILEVPNSSMRVLTLRLGAAGETVRSLQRDLSKLGYHTGAQDGLFGKRTRAAVLAFQADNHLVTDGIVGSATREALALAQSREITATRANATIVTLAASGSRVSNASLKNGAVGALFAGGGVMSIFEQSSGVVTELTAHMGAFGAALERLSPWMGAVIMAGGAYVVIQSARAAYARLDDHRKGKTA